MLGFARLSVMPKVLLLPVQLECGIEVSISKFLLRFGRHTFER